MKTSSCKQKGRRCCQETKDLMHKHSPVLEQGDIYVTSSGETGEDLKLSPAARKVYPIVVECKNVEKLNVFAAMEQCEGHKRDTQWEPALFFKKNRTKLYACIDAEYLIRLLTIANKQTENK